MAKLLDQLRMELAYIDAAILSLEGLQGNQGRIVRVPKVRRGRRKAAKPQPDGERKGRHHPDTG